MSPDRIGSNGPAVANSDLPLAGIRVLEIATAIAGPYAAALLGVLGAEVVKIENPQGGDPFRRWGAAGESTGKMFARFNAGKKSVALDLNRPDDVRLLLARLPEFDILISNSRPGMLDRVGLGQDVCLSINPRLVYVSATAFGNVGPLSGLAGYDTVAQSVGGLLSAYSADDAHATSLPPTADLAMGILTATAALAGLANVLRGRGGMTIETSLLEAVASLMTVSYALASPGEGEKKRHAPWTLNGRRPQSGAVAPSLGEHNLEFLSYLEPDAT